MAAANSTAAKVGNVRRIATLETATALSAARIPGCGAESLPSDSTTAATMSAAASSASSGVVRRRSHGSAMASTLAAAGPRRPRLQEGNRHYSRRGWSLGSAVVRRVPTAEDSDIRPTRRSVMSVVQESPPRQTLVRAVPALVVAAPLLTLVSELIAPREPEGKTATRRSPSSSTTRPG